MENGLPAPELGYVPLPSKPAAAQQPGQVSARPPEKAPPPTKERLPGGAINRSYGCICTLPSCRMKPHHVTCLQLCCARLSCSWCIKVTILLAAVQLLFLIGPLSQPIWIPVSLDKACQTNDDPGKKPAPFSHQAPVRNLEDCKAACTSMKGCQAIDYFNITQWCNFYSTACTKPTAVWDEASSYQITVICTMHNGSTGVLIAGHCVLGIEVPTVTSTVMMEVPLMLTSPRSWGCSLLVACIYTYIMSPWFQQKLRPVTWPCVSCCAATCRWVRAGKGRRALFLLLLAAAWVAFTIQTFGPPPTSIKRAVKDTPSRPMVEWMWLGGSAIIFLMLLCKGLRTVILSAVLALGGCLMSGFTSVAACAMSSCVDVSAASAAGAAGLVGAGTAALATDAAVTAEGAVAAEAMVGAEAVAGTDGAVAADAAACGGAAAEASAAADAAVAAEAAAAAEAATAAEGLAALAVCTLM